MKKSVSVVLSFLLGFAAGSCHFFTSMDPSGYDRISDFTFSKNSLSMPAGAMDMLAISVNPSDRQDNLAIEWSYDSSIIDVQMDNYTLIITGLKKGETIIRGIADGISSSCVVSITEGSLPPVITNPYVYSNTEIVDLVPGETVRVAASLYGGTSADINGFTFSIDKSLVASVATEGNYAWITGRGEGIARVSVRHNRAAYAYTFLVSCQPDGQAVPYITTASNVITINKSIETEAAFSVELHNPPALGTESLFTFKVTDETYSPMADPPVSITATGNRCVITPLYSGEAYVQVSHPSAPYTLNVLVRVTEQLDDVYINPSAAVLYVPGTSAQIISASLVNVPADITASQNDFSWSFPPNAAEYLSYTVFGGSEEGRGNSLWITGKKSGSLRLTITHPLAMYSRDVFVIIKNITGEASDASTYITTSQNYIVAKPGDSDINLAIYINNAQPGSETSLHWQIVNDAADGSSDPVITFTGGTGTSASSSARSAELVQVATGYALISPKKEGTAIITISHPKAIYDTKVMVVVSSSETARPAPFVISTNSPVKVIQNGESLDLSVSLSGPGVTPADYADLVWRSGSAALAIAPNGLNAVVTASESGTGSEIITLTISHPRADWPLQTTLVRYETPEDLSDVKYIIANNPYLTIFSGISSYLYLDMFNIEEEDIVVWNVPSGNNTVISFDQEGKSRARITGIAGGTAVVTAAFGTETASWFINVKQDGTIDEDLPAYLSTGQNVVVLDPGTQAQVSVTPINIVSSVHDQIAWSNSDPALIEVIPNGSAATVQSKAGTGKAVITVSHPLSANSLEIHVHVGDQYEYKNSDIAYISVPADTLTLKAGSADTLFQAVLAHTESSDISTEGFSYSVLDSAVASASASGPAALISPKKTGQTKLLISHPLAVSDSEVLIIVEPADGETGTPYITTSQNVVTVVAGEITPVTVTLKNKFSFTVAEWSWASLDASVTSIVANNGATAMIFGESPGTAHIRVSNTNAAYSLDLIVICLDANAVQAHPWIKTSTNIVNLKVNDSTTVTAEMAGGVETDNSAFVWSPQDSTAVFTSGSGSSVFIKGLRAGLSYITVRNNNYPETYTKTVLVLVEDTVKEDCYITLNQSILKLKPDASGSENLKAVLVGGSVLDPESFVWWADDYQMVGLTSITDTAQITPLGKSGITTVHVKHPKALLPVDILVVISNFDQFGFGMDSKTISQGGIFFIPMQVPPTAETSTVTYSSANPSVCSVTGSKSVAMIAGINYGQTAITAVMKDAKGTVLGTSELMVIVSYVTPDVNKIVVKASIINMEPGSSQTLQASLSGPEIGPSDAYDIQWVSSDPSVLSITATEQDITKGNSAYITAKSAGEAVITLSHPKCRMEEQIWVLVPEQDTVAVMLDESYIELFKDEGSRTITATLLNAQSSDYETISWSAPKIGGQVIISISKSTGKTCTIVPRNVGQTTIRAQLPSGAYADCIISVRSAAEINLETMTIRVNPGYTQTVHYTTNPEAANVTWIGMGNNGADVSNIFSFDVNESAKTINITGKDIGSGYLQGYFASSQGSSTKQLHIYVEYNYQFDLKTSGYITREPRPGVVIQIPFTVYPYDMVVTARSSDESKMFIKSISQNTMTGEGMVEITPLGESSNLSVQLQAKNLKDTVNPPLERIQYVNLRYENLTITPVFDYAAGSFTEYRDGILYLGDGEAELFHLDISEPNAQLNNISVEWINGGYPDSRTTDEGGYITLSREHINADTGKQMYRIQHTVDHKPASNDYYLVSKALKYRVRKTSYVFLGDTTTTAQTIDTETTKGVKEWYLREDIWWNDIHNVKWTEDRLNGKSDNELLSIFLRDTSFTHPHTGHSGDRGAGASWIYTLDDRTTVFGISVGDLYTCQIFYEDINPYVISKNDLQSNPDFYRPYFRGRDFRDDALNSKDEWNYITFEAKKIHQYATETGTKDTGILGQFAASFVISYQRFNGEVESRSYPVKVQKRMCESYSKGMWKLVGKKYVYQP